MKQGICIGALLLLSIQAFGQNTTKDKYLKADAFLRVNNTLEAYKLYKEIKPTIGLSDTLYNYVVWYYVNTATQLEKESLMKEDYANSLKYGLEALKLIQDNKGRFDQKFAE